MLVLYGIFNSIQFGSVEDKSTTHIYIYIFIFQDMVAIVHVLSLNHV